MSEVKVNKVSPRSGTALQVGDSGDTITVPSGAILTTTNATVNLPATTTVSTELKTNKISPASGTAFTLGDSGDTFTVPVGATITNSGTATGFGGGKVLQVVFGSTTTEKVVSSATFVDTGLSAAITPSATSSKILVICEVSSVGKATTNTYVELKLLRDTTDLIVFTKEAGADAGTSTNKVGNSGCSYLDSPSSTSSITYKTQMNSGSGSTYGQTGGSGGVSTMTLMEIAG